jgi:hypothetical protein
MCHTVSWCYLHIMVTVTTDLPETTNLDTGCIFFEAGPELFNIIQMSFMLRRVKRRRIVHC